MNEKSSFKKIKKQKLFERINQNQNIGHNGKLY